MKKKNRETRAKTERRRKKRIRAETNRSDKKKSECTGREGGRDREVLKKMYTIIENTNKQNKKKT